MIKSSKSITEHISGRSLKQRVNKQYTSMTVVARASECAPTWKAMNTASYTSDRRSVITSLNSVTSLRIH